MTQEQETISVIIPIYKTEDYLRRCLDSVVNQTYKKLEIILVDDGSPDKSGEICDEYAQKDNRIKVIHKENGGVSSARNAALDIACGEYVTFVDSDDYIHPEACAILFNAAKETSSDVVVCGFINVFADKHVKNDYAEIKTLENNAILQEYVMDKIRPEACAKLIRKSVIGEIRFDTNFTCGEDLLFNYYIFKRSSKACVLDKCLYYYSRERETAATGNFNLGCILSYKTTQTILGENINGKLYVNCLWRHVRGLFNILNDIIETNDKQLNKYFEEIRTEILKYRKKISSENIFAKRYKYAVILIQFVPWFYRSIYRIKHTKDNR
ncbi:MAG: glycosyltransferase family 2 protein [Clostridia bacterium]|nr:glycosyltransferase family 2 protein [Clostridia bacterium]